MIVALIVGVTAIATLSLTGSSPTSTVAGYVPADSVAYGELRLDLPGDQRQEVGEFLSKFPGFADQAALETKLDEVLDRLLSEKHGRQADLQPRHQAVVRRRARLLDGTAAATGADAANAATDTPRAVVLLSIKDEALARAWFTNALTEMGVTTVPETYEGVELPHVHEPQGGQRPGGVRHRRRQGRDRRRHRIGQGRHRHRRVQPDVDERRVRRGQGRHARG